MTEDIALSRKRFLQGDIDGLGIRQEVLNSWIRSREAGVDYTKTTLDAASHEELQRLLILDDLRVKRKKIIGEYYEDYYSFIAKESAAIFYTNPELSVVLERGNKKLLSQLKEIGLCVGANLQEESIGTNAAALTYLSHQASYVNGPEHYLAALQEYATISAELTDLYNSKVRGCFVFVTRTENFNMFQLSSLDHLVSVGMYYLDYRLNDSDAQLTNELINNYLFQDKELKKGFIIVNKDGFVLKTTQYIDRKIKRLLRSDRLAEAIPEFQPALECLDSGSPLQLREISIRTEKAVQSVFLEAVPAKKSGVIIGAIITVSCNKLIYKQVQSLSGHYASFSFDDLIGESPVFTATKDFAKKAASFDSNVLITGESGTGKELFAQAIHNASNRRNEPFIAINCGAIPRELIGSELFGFEEGSFTGAREGGSVGKFELANGGTIFFDEIGEMPYDLQAVLLRVIEERAVVRIGGQEKRAIDVRIIAATNANLQESIEMKTFRLDLFYRLNVIRLQIPTLSEHTQDIPLLSAHFLKFYDRVYSKGISDISPELMSIFKAHPWPGNIRELRNAIESAYIACQSSVLSIQDLPPDTQRTLAEQAFNDQSGPASTNVSSTCAEPVEKELLTSLMQKYYGNKSRIAKELNIARATLYRRLEKYGISEVE